MALLNIIVIIEQESTAALKKAEAEEEARLYQKLERDRLDLQKAFEEEQKQKKVREGRGEIDRKTVWMRNCILTVCFS